MASFARMASADGGELRFVARDGALLRFVYRPGSADPACEGGVCMLPQAEIEAMMREWLSRSAPDMRLSIEPLEN